MEINKKYPVCDIRPTNGGETNETESEFKPEQPNKLNWYTRFIKRDSPPAHEIFYGENVNDVPVKKIRKPCFECVSAYCAPGSFIDKINKQTSKNIIKRDLNHPTTCQWKTRSDFAYGTLYSLYETDIKTNIRSGDPLADSLAVVVRKNCGLLAVADGVSWGRKSELASNCAVHGAITHLCENIHDCTNTKDVFCCILKGFERAQAQIIDEGATLTTLCVGVVVQLKEANRWAFCVVNVGDTYAYVFSENDGVQEVTHGSHSLDKERDMRFSGGSLGPADGYNPDLSNLTCSFTILEKEDYVFMCSDGISDNFDPVVSKMNPPGENAKEKQSQNTFCPPAQGPVMSDKLTQPTRNKSFISCSTPYCENESKVVTLLCLSKSWSPQTSEPLTLHEGSAGQSSTNQLLQPEHRDTLNGPETENIVTSVEETATVYLSPRQRHDAALNHMNEVIKETQISKACELCSQLINFVVRRTEGKRQILEKYPRSTLNELSPNELKERNMEMKVQLEGVPGKLDHAAIVAYQVGLHEREMRECDRRASLTVNSLPKSSQNDRRVSDVEMMSINERCNDEKVEATLSQDNLWPITK